jgi:hypothetical protein
MVKSMVDALVKETPANSVVGRIVDEVISDAALRGQQQQSGRN